MGLNRHLLRSCPRLLFTRSFRIFRGDLTFVASEDSRSKAEEYEQARPFNEIPGPRGLPYFGTLHQYRIGRFRSGDYHKAQLERHRKYGKIVKETINGETVVHLFDPAYVQTMYQNEGKSPRIVPLLETIQMYRKYRDMSPGLGNTNGDEWYRLRSAVQKVILTPRSVMTLLPYVNDVTDDFIRRMTRIRDPVSGEISNYDNEIAKWNLESCGYSCFEKRLGCLDEEEEGKGNGEGEGESWQQKVINANSAIFELSAKMYFSVPLHRIFETPTWKKLLKTEDFFYSKTLNLVDEAIEDLRSLIDRGRLDEGRYALLRYLINRKELSYKDVSVLILSLFTDGLSTTTPSLVGQLFCIATNPEKQEKLFAEVTELLPEPETPITDDVIQRAVYLKACIKEGFRFFPINIGVSRISPKDIVIGGYQIPAGTVVSLDSNLLLQLPEYFENPESYLPERWIRGGSGDSVHPYLHLPFSHGPRTCAGMRLSEQEMRVLIMKLLRKFRIAWRKGGGEQGEEEQDTGQRYAMLLKPRFQPRFQFHPRN